MTRTHEPTTSYKLMCCDTSGSTRQEPGSGSGFDEHRHREQSISSLYDYTLYDNDFLLRNCVWHNPRYALWKCEALREVEMAKGFWTFPRVTGRSSV